LEALLLEGLTKGKDIPVSPGFWSELRRDAAKIQARKKPPERGRSRRIA
jgi:hypothetical protein